MNPRVLILTATTGRDSLARTIESVQSQTYRGWSHLILIDGIQHESATLDILADFDNTHIRTLTLPWQTKDYGGTPYAIGSLLANGHHEFISYLDDDNWYHPIHLQTLVELAAEEPKKNFYASRRTIWTEHKGVLRAVCQDHPEEEHIDTSCFMLPSKVAHDIAPHWSSGVYYNDRMVRAALGPGAISDYYTLNYFIEFSGLHPEIRASLDKGEDTMFKYRNIEPKGQVKKGRPNEIIRIRDTEKV